MIATTHTTATTATTPATTATTTTIVNASRIPTSPSPKARDESEAQAISHARMYQAMVDMRSHIDIYTEV